jgi:glycosyltransferase involved in cell wall biosynthesis
MLYFVGFTAGEGNWTGSFNRAVCDELARLGVAFRKLPPFDWQGTAVPLAHYSNIQSTAEDCWFIGWAQSPLIELIQAKPGRKFGLVTGLTAGHFDPMVFSGQPRALRERARLGLYDRIFANSHWCAASIFRAYPELASRVAVTGFPFDFDRLAPYRGGHKDERLVVFNQRFSIERLPVLELETARLLIRQGLRVRHLLGTQPQRLARSNPGLASLLHKAEQAGLEFIFNATKEQYHQQLARASVVVTTSIADMLPSSMIEAIAMGAVPVAPAAFCFPEFVHRDNLYAPYDLEEIISLVQCRPQRIHSIDQYAKDHVVRRFLTEMKQIKKA